MCAAPAALVLLGRSFGVWLFEKSSSGVWSKVVDLPHPPCFFVSKKLRYVFSCPVRGCERFCGGGPARSKQRCGSVFKPSSLIEMNWSRYEPLMFQRLPVHDAPALPWNLCCASSRTGKCSAVSILYILRSYVWLK